MSLRAWMILADALYEAEVELMFIESSLRRRRALAAAFTNALAGEAQAKRLEMEFEHVA